VRHPSPAVEDADDRCASPHHGRPPRRLGAPSRRLGGAAQGALPRGWRPSGPGGRTPRVAPWTARCSSAVTGSVGAPAGGASGEPRRSVRPARCCCRAARMPSPVARRTASGADCRSGTVRVSWAAATRPQRPRPVAARPEPSTGRRDFDATMMLETTCRSGGGAGCMARWRTAATVRPPTRVGVPTPRTHVGPRARSRRS
jgi:hypothetical protein